MKSEYDFSDAVRGRYAGRIPPDAVFVSFDPDVSELLAGPGDFTTRLRSLARSRTRAGKARKIVRSVALSPAEYRTLKPVLDRLGGRAIGDPPPATAAHSPRKRKAG